MSRPGLTPSMVCVKNLILGLNCLLVMTGMLLIAVGATIKGVYDTFDVIISNDLISPASFLMFTGAVVFVVAMFGCIGAIKESTCLVNLYTLLLLLIFIFELSAGIAGFVMQSSVTGTLSRNFRDAIQNHYIHDSEVSDVIDSIQSNVRCCGANGPEDWTGVLTNDSFNLLEGDVIVPNSCCGFWNGTEPEPECGKPFTVGCLPTLVDVAKDGAVLLTGAAITVALIQAMAVYFANELAKGIRQAKSLRTLRQMQIREQLVSTYQPMSKEQPSSPTPVIYLAAAGTTEDTAA